MNTISDYSKIILAVLAVSSISIPVASQAGGFNPAMRDSGHRSTAAVRPNRQHQGGEVRHQRRDHRSGVSVRSRRSHGYSRAPHSRPYVRHSGRHYIRHNRPIYRHGHSSRQQGYYRSHYNHYRPYYRTSYGHHRPYYRHHGHRHGHRYNNRRHHRRHSRMFRF